MRREGPSKPAPMEDIPALELSRATIRSRRGVARSVTPNRSRVGEQHVLRSAALASKEQLIALEAQPAAAHLRRGQEVPSSPAPAA